MRLQEAKALQGHRGAKTPWGRRSVLTAVRAAAFPARQKARQLAGSVTASRKMATLEASLRKELRDILRRVEDEDDSPSTRRMKATFREHYRTAFRLGRVAGGAWGSRRSGKLPPMSEEDNRWLESYLREEFGYWKKFMEDVRGGKTRMPPVRRVEMYVKSLRGAYHSARVLETPPQTLFDWILRPAEHCAHCTYLAKHGPYTRANLPTVPRAGITRCLSRCRCKLRTRQVGFREHLRVARSSPTRREHLRAMRAAGR